jgi:hypothetical protein
MKNGKSDVLGLNMTSIGGSESDRDCEQMMAVSLWTGNGGRESKDCEYLTISVEHTKSWYQYNCCGSCDQILSQKASPSLPQA